MSILASNDLLSTSLLISFPISADTRQTHTDRASWRFVDSICSGWRVLPLEDITFFWKSSTSPLTVYSYLILLFHGHPGPHSETCFLNLILLPLVPFVEMFVFCPSAWLSLSLLTSLCKFHLIRQAFPDFLVSVESMPTMIWTYLTPFLFTVLTIASKNFPSTAQCTAIVYEHCELSTHQTASTGRVGVRKMST